MTARIAILAVQCHLGAVVEYEFGITPAHLE